MAITYPLTMPTDPRPRSVVAQCDYVVSANVSPFTRATQKYKWPGEQWRFDIVLPPMTREQAGEWVGFGHKLRGSYGNFLLGDPAGYEPMGTALGTPLVDGADQTGYYLNTKGWTADQAAALKPGDYFQLGAADTARLHQIVDTIASDGGGLAQLHFAPALRYSPADEAAITLIEPMGVFALEDPSVSWNVDIGQEHGFRFSAVEVIE